MRSARSRLLKPASRPSGMSDKLELCNEAMSVRNSVRVLPSGIFRTRLFAVSAATMPYSSSPLVSLQV